MNGPIEDIAKELGFQGNPFLQGLVVSIFIVGALFGSLGSSALVDKFGCKRTLQIDSIPLIIGAFLRYLLPLYCVLTIFLSPDFALLLLTNVVFNCIEFGHQVSELPLSSISISYIIICCILNYHKVFPKGKAMIQCAG